MNESPAMNSMLALRVPSTPFLFSARGAALAVLLAASAVLSSSCGSTNSTPNSTNAPGTVLVNPATGTQFVVEPNHSGQAHRVLLTTSFWGRLVDVYDFDPATGNSTLQFKDYVIGDNIASDQIDFRLDRNVITEADTLTILHPVGTPAFQVAFSQIELNVQPVRKNGLNPPPSSTLTAIPRNAAMVLVFDDLISDATINSKDIAVLTGYPPIQPFEARVIPDLSHGDLFDADGDGAVEFHTTRVIIDMTVSQIESQQSNPPLPINSVGLPEAQVVNQPNVLIRIPTKVVPAIGQLVVLSNLSGTGIDFNANTPNDPSSPTLDLVRSLRSSSGDVGDPNNGFLIDDVAPRIVGVQGIQLLSVLPLGGTSYLIDAQFDAAVCAPTPHPGDVIRIGGSVLAVVHQIGNAPSGGFITGVIVDLQLGSAATFLPGQAQYLLPFSVTAGSPPACFMRFSPPPLLPPDGGIAPNSTITVRFSEPMDPTSVTGLESFTVKRVDNISPAVPLGNTIVASVQPSLDLREYTYTPQLPFERDTFNFAPPAAERYQLVLRSGASGPIDLSGKPLADALAPFNFQLDPNAANVRTRGIVFDFNSSDQDNNGAPELRGQFLFNLSKGSIRPRTVARFSAVADQNQPVVGLMVPFTAPIQTPLSNLGSKMMTVYRYHDLGLGLLDDSSLNIDLEGLAWSPFIGLQVDTFSKFRMAFCHSKYLPDEIISAASLLPIFPNSGLVKQFDNNVVDPVNDPLTITHPKDRGYNLQPVDSFVASTGTLMMPYPLNRGLTKAQYLRYTFRDTALLAVGAPFGQGVETAINGLALGVSLPTSYPVNKVPTLGLPLLMEFRCYPDDLAFGINGFKVNIAVNSSARPALRAFSTGGVNTSGQVIKIDPDNQPNAQGGYQPNGQTTGFGSELDPVFYVGQADFVVRVNRIHTIWQNSGGSPGSVRYETPIVEPPAALQPAGTQVIVALRGATILSQGQGTTPLPAFNAGFYDPYGDPKAQVLLPPAVTQNWSPTYPIGTNGQPDNTWKTNLALLNNQGGGFGPIFVQARITLISNPDTLLFPEITAMGFSFTH